MFHTGVGEGELAPSVLMPGDPARSKIISGCFKDAKFVSSRRTYATYTGVTPNTDVPISVVSSGMGPLSVSTVAEELKMNRLTPCRFIASQMDSVQSRLLR